MAVSIKPLYVYSNAAVPTTPISTVTCRAERLTTARFLSLVWETGRFCGTPEKTWWSQSSAGTCKSCIQLFFTYPNKATNSSISTHNTCIETHNTCIQTQNTYTNTHVYRYMLILYTAIFHMYTMSKQTEWLVWLYYHTRALKEISHEAESLQKKS